MRYIFFVFVLILSGCSSTKYYNTVTRDKAKAVVFKDRKILFEDKALNKFPISRGTIIDTFQKSGYELYSRNSIYENINNKLENISKTNESELLLKVRPEININKYECRKDYFCIGLSGVINYRVLDIHTGKIVNDYNQVVNINLPAHHRSTIHQSANNVDKSTASVIRQYLDQKLNGEILVRQYEYRPLKKNIDEKALDFIYKNDYISALRVLEGANDLDNSQKEDLVANRCNLFLAMNDKKSCQQALKESGLAPSSIDFDEINRLL